MPDVMVKVGVFADAIQVMLLQLALLKSTVTALPAVANELASKMTLLPEPGVQP